MFRTIHLELFLPFRPFKKTASIRLTTISAQILHESKTKWRFAPKRKTGAAAKQTADCTALQSQMTIESRLVPSRYLIVFWDERRLNK